MAFISYEPEEETAAQTRNLLTLYRDPKTGRADNILRIHSKNPASMRSHFDIYTTLMHARSALSRTQREMIAVTVSGINGCVY